MAKVSMPSVGTWSEKRHSILRRLSDLKIVAHTQWTIPNLKAQIEKEKHQYRQEIVKAIQYLTHEEHQATGDQYVAFDYADLRGPLSHEFNETLACALKNMQGCDLT